MSRRPHKGEITDTITFQGGRDAQGLPVLSAAEEARAERDGSWRGDRNWNRRHGLRIAMRNEPRVTDPTLLRVPFRFQVPVTDDFTRPYHVNWSTFDTVRAGQRSRPDGEQLLELSINTMFLDQEAQDATSGVVVWPYAPEPQRLLHELRTIMREEQPFRLVIGQEEMWGGPLVNNLSVLTALEPSERAGHAGTEFVGITFLEYDELQASEARRRHQHRHTVHHKVRFGHDTLYGLAKHYYHQASLWREIAHANGITDVSPSSATGLERWCKHHHKRTLRIPPAPELKLAWDDQPGLPGVDGTGGLEELAS